MSLKDQPMGVEPSTVATSPDPDFVGATPQAEHSHERIASELDLERFSTLPIEQRQLTEPLRGVLAETALSGVIRYNWTLLRPLVEFGLSQVLEEYEARAAAEGAGPTRPAFPGESLACTQARFRRCLHRFARAPWTLQRLCELLLAPRTQYLKLHKVALAIEKCLMVTSEVPTLPDPPPPPALADLGAVNVNPPPVQSKERDSWGQDSSRNGARSPPRHAAGLADPDLDSSMAFTSTLLTVQDAGPRPTHSPPASPTAAGAGAASSPTKAGQMDCSNNDQQQQLGGGEAGGSTAGSPGAGGAAAGAAAAAAAAAAVASVLTEQTSSPGSSGGSGGGGGGEAGRGGTGSPGLPSPSSTEAPPAMASPTRRAASPVKSHYHSPHAGHTSGVEHMEEDHWPDAQQLSMHGRGGLALHPALPHALGSHSLRGSSPPSTALLSPPGLRDSPRKDGASKTDNASPD